MVAIKTLWTAVLLAGVALVESKACKKPFIRREWYEIIVHLLRTSTDCEQALSQYG